jgi:hypothetical protein
MMELWRLMAFFFAGFFTVAGLLFWAIGFGWVKPQ